MWEYIGSWNDPNYMAHSGVKGQKWGVRRYQNQDGSLTPEGKRHYALLGGSTVLVGGAGAGAYRHRKEIASYAKNTVAPAAKRAYEHTLGAASRAFANRDAGTVFGRAGALYEKAAGNVSNAYGKTSNAVTSAYNKASNAVNKAYESTVGATGRAIRNRDMNTTVGRAAEGVASAYRNVSGSMRNATNAVRKVPGSVRQASWYAKGAVRSAGRNARTFAREYGKATGINTRPIGTAANYVRGGVNDLKTLGYAMRTGQAGSAARYLANSKRAKVALGTAAGLGAAAAGAAGYGIYRAVKNRKSKKRR